MPNEIIGDSIDNFSYNAWKWLFVIFSKDTQNSLQAQAKTKIAGMMAHQEDLFAIIY